MVLTEPCECVADTSPAVGRAGAAADRAAMGADAAPETVAASTLAGPGPGRASTGQLPAAIVIIVGFHNPGDLVGCLRALSRMQAEPRFEIFIAENGGPAATDGLVDALIAADGPCRPTSEPDPIDAPAGAPRRFLVRLKGEAAGPAARVHVAEMPDNLGYAGAINAWLRPLLQRPGWQGAWILNPDTEPTPSALAELVDYAARRGKGMVGSRITVPTAPDHVRTRGLAWHKLSARTAAIDYGASAAIEPDPDEVEARLDAPSGSSFYVTRDMIARIGLMDESYFLFFEDLEWGYRAKAIGGLGHAHRSIVPHQGGTTIGSAGGRAAVSPLSVYLEFRNRIAFVRQKHRAWMPWTVLMLSAHMATFLVAGSSANALAACRGLAAGLKGEAGRPDRILRMHRS